MTCKLAITMVHDPCTLHVGNCHVSHADAPLATSINWDFHSPRICKHFSQNLLHKNTIKKTIGNNSWDKMSTLTLSYSLPTCISSNIEHASHHMSSLTKSTGISPFHVIDSFNFTGGSSRIVTRHFVWPSHVIVSFNNSNNVIFTWLPALNKF